MKRQAKQLRLDHVKFVRRGDRLYAYFNTGQKKDGKVIYAPLPPPSSPDFFTKYAALKAGRTKRQSVIYTVANLVDEYLKSAEFAGKAKATQALYTIQLDKAAQVFEKVPAHQLNQTAIHIVLDGEGWGAASQNAFLGALGAAYKWGRERDKTTAEPCKGIVKRKMGTHEPWPQDVVEAALKSTDERVRLAVHLLYFTGQRIGDICAMRWSQIKDGFVSLTQQKTGMELTFPASRELLAELEQTPKRGLHILTNQAGGKVTPNSIRDSLITFAAAQGVKRVPHGLRKNAVNSLLEAGCSAYEVSAITGQSLGMVEHYAARVDKRRLGQSAILKFDATRKKTA